MARRSIADRLNHLCPDWGDDLAGNKWEIYPVLFCIYRVACRWDNLSQPVATQLWVITWMPGNRVFLKNSVSCRLIFSCHLQRELIGEREL